MRELAPCSAAYYKPLGWVYFRKEKGWPRKAGQPRLTARGGALLSWGHQIVLNISSLFLDSLRLNKIYKFTSP